MIAFPENYNRKHHDKWTERKKLYIFCIFVPLTTFLFFEVASCCVFCTKPCKLQSQPRIWSMEPRHICIWKPPAGRFWCGQNLDAGFYFKGFPGFSSSIHPPCPSPLGPVKSWTQDSPSTKIICLHSCRSLKKDLNYSSDVLNVKHTVAQLICKGCSVLNALHPDFRGYTFFFLGVRRFFPIGFPDAPLISIFTITVIFLINS